ncbi:MAG: hypothetical protein WBF14_04920, partial [Candidatus Acidiferrales bacterium]
RLGNHLADPETLVEEGRKGAVTTDRGYIRTRRGAKAFRRVFIFGLLSAANGMDAALMTLRSET